MKTLIWNSFADVISAMLVYFVFSFHFLTWNTEVMATRRYPITSYACEDGDLLLECQEGEVIRILRANYGRFTLNVCNRDGQTEGWSVQCRYAKSKEIISRRCDGHRDCRMRVNNHIFADPCPSTSKYAEVKYICELAPTERTSVKPTSTKKPDSPRVTLNQAPDPPVIISVRALSSEDIEVTWTQIPPESPVLTTTAYYIDRGMNLRPLAFFSKSNHSLIIKDLRPNTVYDILLKSFNKHGVSLSSNVVSVKTLPVVTSSSPLSSSSVNLKTISSNLVQTSSSTSTSQRVITPEFTKNKTILSPFLTKPTLKDQTRHQSQKIAIISRFTKKVITSSNPLKTSLNTSMSQRVITPEYTKNKNTHSPFFTKPTLKNQTSHQSQRTTISSNFTSTLTTSSNTIKRSSSTSTSQRMITPEITKNKNTLSPFPTKLALKNQTSHQSQKITFSSSFTSTLSHYPSVSTTETAPTTTPKPVESLKQSTSKPVSSSTATTTTTTTVKTTSTKKPEPQTPEKWLTDKEKHPPKDKDVPKDKDGAKGAVRYCAQEKSKDFVWPQTRYGRVAQHDCPKDLKGKVTWRCTRNGWHTDGPDFSKCVSAWLMDLDVQVQQAMEGKEPADKAAIALSSALKDKTLTPADLKRTTLEVLPKLCEGLHKVSPFETKPQRRRRIKKFKQAFMNASSQLLSDRQTRSWHRLSRTARRQAVTSLVLAVEDTGFQTASLMDAGSSDVTVFDNIVLEIKSVNTDERFGDLHFPLLSKLDHSPWQGTTDKITIPRMNLEFAQTQGLVNVVFTIYKNMEELVEPQTKTYLTVEASTSESSEGFYNAGFISDDSSDDSSSQPPFVLNTNIISASINSPNTKLKLPEPIKFSLHHLKILEGSSPMCSFLDIDSSSQTGTWSQDGCRIIESNVSQTTCECDHLTNFAVLMDVSGLRMSKEHVFVLHVITYVGCIISIICLLLAWITFTIFKNLQCDRNTIHKNLVFCLMLAEIVFLAGIGQTEYKVLCSVIAGLLHYLFLGAFAWMCLEGVQLYVMLVEVFELEKSRIKWYYLFGYGVPLIIVAVAAAIRFEGYGTHRHCWLTSENYFVWSFVGPALTVVLINFGMLSIAIYTMCRHSNISTTMKERTKAHKFSISESYCSMETYAPPKLRFPELPAWVKGAIVLMVLLGSTWILGVFYLSQESIAMAYAFTILNSLQGLFIFVFHCLMNEKVQKEYRKVARRTAWLPDCIRVNYGGYTGVATSSQNNSSGSGNIFSKLLGSRRRKQSTNSSMKPFLNQDQHRRSSTENSSSRDSSTIPTSLNGYIYKPNFNEDPNRALTNNNGCHKLSINGHGPLEPCYETVEGLAGELSECIDCSVVDSEMVSEYCKNNMKVSQEQRRYSTGSENSDYETPQPLTQLEVPSADADALSNLSCNSSKKPLSSFVSTSEVATCSNLDLSEDEPEDEIERSLDFHLEQYIIPTRPRNEEGVHLDQKSSSMNKLSKATMSLSSIPEPDASQHHSSSPNIQFKPGFSTPMAHPNHVLLTNQGFEESNSDNCASPSSEVSSPSSVKSSLPNISFQTNYPFAETEYEGSNSELVQKQRPSSEADMNFSSFRMPSSDC